MEKETEKENRFIYNRTLKLAPALGDWTTIKLQDPEVNDIQVSQVKSANFDSLPREKMKHLHMQHYRFSEMITRQFSKDMNIKIELHTIHATQMTYQDFLKSQQDLVIQSDFCLKNNGNINVLFDWELAEMMVNRLTGGKGTASIDKSFTDLEKIALEVQMESIVPLLSQFWSSVFSETDVSLIFNTGEYRYDKKISLREAYSIFSFYLYFGKGTLHKLIIAYPSNVLRQLMKQQAYQEEKLTPTIQLNKKTLSQPNMPISVTLGKTDLTMSQLKALECGSVIMLDAELNKPLEVNIGNHSIFLAQPGIQNKRFALQILSPNTESNQSKPFQFSNDPNDTPNDTAITTEESTEQSTVPVIEGSENSESEDIDINESGS